MNEKAWTLWTAHGIMRARVKGETCPKCGGDDFVAEVVDAPTESNPLQKDMTFSCVKCEGGFRLVNVYPTGIEWGFQESDGVEVKELPLSFKAADFPLDTEKTEALKKWREMVVPIPPPSGDAPSFQDFQDRAYAEIGGAPRIKPLPGKVSGGKLMFEMMTEGTDEGEDDKGAGGESRDGGAPRVSEDGPGGAGDDPA